MEKSTAIATIDTFRFPTEQSVTDMYDPEEFEDIALDYPRVKIPSGGQLSFELPNPDNPDDPSICKTLEGVVVLQHTSNSYWAHSDTTNTPPDCNSDDGVTGYGNPGGKCASCPLNEFGSGEGGAGKACKNMKNIYLLRSGDMIPLLISMPPTSLKAFKNYANNLRFAGRGFSSVVTVIGLKKQESNGNTYSVATFRSAGPLTSEIAKTAQAFSRRMRESMMAARAEHAMPVADYGTSPDIPTGVDPDTGEIIPSEF